MTNAILTLIFRLKDVWSVNPARAPGVQKGAQEHNSLEGTRLGRPQTRNKQEQESP
jgi:hypothetical protein